MIGEEARRVNIWVADAARGLIRRERGESLIVGPPGNALCSAGDKIFCAGPGRCFCCAKEGGGALFDFPVPSGVCALTAAGGAVFALSADADSVTAFSAPSGELLFSAPAGVYPRAMCLSPCGKYLAVAGGAAGEALIFDRSLTCLKRYRTAGAVCAVCFLTRALAVLCAVGDRELSSHLLFISPRGVTEEIFSCDSAPCALCALPDGRCVLGCHGEIIALRPDGKLSFRFPCPFPARLYPSRMGVLVCDPWQGKVFLLRGGTLYAGNAPEDAILTI